MGWRCARCWRRPAATGGLARFLYGPCGPRPPGMVWERRLHLPVVLADGRTVCGRCGFFSEVDGPEVWSQRTCPARWLAGLGPDPPDWGAWVARRVGAPGPPAWVDGAPAAAARGGVQMRLGSGLTLQRPTPFVVLPVGGAGGVGPARPAGGGQQLLPWAPAVVAGGPGAPVVAAPLAPRRGRVRARPLGVAGPVAPARVARRRRHPAPVGGEVGGPALPLAAPAGAAPAAPRGAAGLPAPLGGGPRPPGPPGAGGAARPGGRSRSPGRAGTHRRPTSGGARARRALLPAASARGQGVLSFAGPRGPVAPAPPAGAPPPPAGAGVALARRPSRPPPPV